MTMFELIVYPLLGVAFLVVWMQISLSAKSTIDSTRIRIRGPQWLWLPIDTREQLEFSKLLLVRLLLIITIAIATDSLIQILRDVYTPLATTIGCIILYFGVKTLKINLLILGYVFIVLASILQFAFYQTVNLWPVLMVYFVIHGFRMGIKIKMFA